MESKMYPITVNLSDYTLDIEQLDNLVSEYIGKILDAYDEPMVEIEFEDLNNSKSFLQALNLTYKRVK